MRRKLNVPYGINKPDLYVFRGGAPIVKGWAFLRWNPETGLFHGWQSKIGEFTVDHPLVWREYLDAYARYAKYNTNRRTPAENHRIDNMLARESALRCSTYARRVGTPGVALYTPDPLLTELLALSGDVRAQRRLQAAQESAQREIAEAMDQFAARYDPAA